MTDPQPDPDVYAVWTQALAAEGRSTEVVRVNAQTAWRSGSMETLVETVCRACEDAVRTGSAVLIDEPRVLTPATLSTLTAFADHRGLRILMHTTAPDELPPHVRAAVKPVALAVSAPALEYWRTFREAPVPPPRAAKPRYTR